MSAALKAIILGIASNFTMGYLAVSGLYIALNINLSFYWVEIAVNGAWEILWITLGWFSEDNVLLEYLKFRFEC